ncbi:MAG TPA: hypothetical protein ENJ38_08395 [Rhodospirillales bacterium]|nr:hypothetical protein [Rhodospirillales bacterium]
MNEETFNMSVRKFLKKLGITAQRELEQRIREAVASGRLTGREELPVKARVTLPEVGLDLEVEGRIALE